MRLARVPLFFVRMTTMSVTMLGTAMVRMLGKQPVAFQLNVQHGHEPSHGQEQSGKETRTRH